MADNIKKPRARGCRVYLWAIRLQNGWDLVKRFRRRVGYATYLAVQDSRGRPAITAMALYSIPPNTGKVRVAMFLGGKFAVWNGKSGKNEFRILCKDRKQAVEVAGIINKKQHDGSIEVLG